MYQRAAPFYDLQYRFLDHAGAARRVLEDIVALHPRAATLLDVGCGTGLHVEVLRHHLASEGLDLDPQLLDIARDCCPGTPFHEADMVTFDLGRRFDVIICLFTAIAYVRTFDRLVATMRRFAAHLEPGGLVLVEPFFTPETYWEGHVKANFVESDGVRMAWMYRQDRRGDEAILDMHYLVGTRTEVLRFSDRHQLGLFTVEQVAAAFAEAGLVGVFDPQGYFTSGIWRARRAPA